MRNTNKQNKCVINKICPNSVCDNCNRERPTAEWIWVVGEAYKCSACGNMNYIMGGKWNYCSNCGARMVESEEEE